jgi:putative membrane protein
MTLLTKAQLKRVEEAVARVEKHTDAELVTVLATHASDYRYLPALWAALIALFVPGVLRLMPLWLDLVDVMLAQILVFAAFALLLRLPPLMRRVVPRSLKLHNASSLARVQFLQHKLHNTRHATGVLIFVSEFERYVEIIVDRGISSKISKEQWQALIDDFVQQVKADNTLQGFLNCINGCSELLARHVPATNQKNELPNRLVLI